MARSTVKSAERALEVLIFLSSVPAPVPAAVIARNVGLPKSSMYHLLNVMLDRRFVAHYSEEGTWGLGAAACDIGSGLPKHEALIRLARPLMARLAQVTTTSALLAVRYGADALVIARADADGPIDPNTPGIGERLPAHVSALGRALLMEEPEGTVTTLFPFADLPALTPRGPRRRTELLELLERSRGRGYATERAEMTLGLGSLAAPVFDHLGYVTSAIGVTYWAGADNHARLELVGDAVRRAASGLSVRLGFRERESAS